MNLSFLRGSTGGSDDSIYTSKTEVWVCGDIAGYRHWIELLRLSAAGAQAKRINPEILGLYSMSLVLQQRVRHREAIVDFSERLYHRPSPVMELVINATTSGYRKMADKIEEFTNLLNDDPDDHIHLDAGMVPWVTATSIALNVRGPMLVWNSVRARVYGPSSGALPTGWLDRPDDDPAENAKLPEPYKFRQRWCRR